MHGIENVKYVIGASNAEQGEEGLTIIMFNPVEFRGNKAVAAPQKVDTEKRKNQKNAIVQR